MTDSDAREPDTQWRTMESAPKDGAEILVARDRHQGVAFWKWDRWNLGCAFTFDKPTHWMPLPLPPPPKE